MEPLEPPALHLVKAAYGWLELGNVPEALTELQRLPADCRALPGVRVARLDCLMAAKDWDAAVVLASGLAVPDWPEPMRCLRGKVSGLQTLGRVTGEGFIFAELAGFGVKTKLIDGVGAGVGGELPSNPSAKPANYLLRQVFLEAKASQNCPCCTTVVNNIGAWLKLSSKCGKKTSELKSS